MNIAKNIKNIAQEVLLNESRAIENLVQLIVNDFEACVKEIYSLKGHVIVTGIGKSAIMANKIVATFNSTGTPAVFIHAADAIGVDLGMILKEDIVICISKSRNIPEIKVLIPLLKRRDSKLVALVSNANCYLAQQADFALNAATGDFARFRSFTSTDFVESHLVRALGKQQHPKVSVQKQLAGFIHLHGLLIKGGIA